MDNTKLVRNFINAYDWATLAHDEPNIDIAVNNCVKLQTKDL